MSDDLTLARQAAVEFAATGDISALLKRIAADDFADHHKAGIWEAVFEADTVSFMHIEEAHWLGLARKHISGLQDPHPVVREMIGGLLLILLEKALELQIPGRDAEAQARKCESLWREMFPPDDYALVIHGALAELGHSEQLDRKNETDFGNFAGLQTQILRHQKLRDIIS